MKVLNFLLIVLYQAVTAKPYSQHVIANNRAFTSMVTKIDALNFQQKVMRKRFKCSAGFKKPEKCSKFYKMMILLIQRKY